MAKLEVKNLRISFRTNNGAVRAVRDISFRLEEGQTLAIVGESGSGKSVNALAIMGLLPDHARVTGSIRFDGRELVGLPEREYRQLRGDDIAMIFQEPMTALDPTMKVGRQIGEVVALHHADQRGGIRDDVLTWLERVGIVEPARIADSFPHELSGGQRQRALIAMALANHPGLVIADEPTTALDVTIQAQILQLMGDLQQEMNTSIMFITHDLGVIAEVSRRVIVMYAGHIVEQSDVRSLFRSPLHPYTQGLLDSKPSLHVNEKRLHVIPGNVPNLLERPTGCQFHPRCKKCFDRCRVEFPPLFTLPDGRQSRCWLNESQAQEVNQ